MKKQNLLIALAVALVGGTINAAVQTANNAAELKKITSNGKPTFVKIYTTWCSACKSVKPHFLATANEVADVNFVEVDADKAKDITAAYAVAGYPTFVLFDKTGKRTEKFVGGREKSDLVAKAKKLKTAKAAK